MASNPWEQACGNGLGTAMGQTIFCFIVPSQMLGFWLGLFLVQTARMGKRMLNQADSFLMTKIGTQTDAVICRHVLSVAIFSHKQKGRRNTCV